MLRTESGFRSARSNFRDRDRLCQYTTQCRTDAENLSSPLQDRTVYLDNIFFRLGVVFLGEDQRELRAVEHLEKWDCICYNIFQWFAIKSASKFETDIYVGVLLSCTNYNIFIYILYPALQLPPVRSHCLSVCFLPRYSVRFQGYLYCTLLSDLAGCHGYCCYVHLSYLGFVFLTSQFLLLLICFVRFNLQGGLSTC